MAFKDLIVHVDNSQSCSGRIGAAIHLAQRHAAHLTALYVIPSFTIPIYAEAQIGPEIIQAQREAATACARAAETAFRRAADRAGLTAEWRLEEGETITGLNLHARYADLVIAGQVDPRDPEWADLRLPERVVLESGRPVIVIPFIGAPQPIGKRIMVAWNASREAVRAVNDALPLLVDADTVEVLAINPPVGEAGDGDIPCADICLHLARHGINAIAESMQAEDIQVGDLLLSRAVDRGVDLIVMGAYGHSRFREIVLSGVSRRLFRHMTTPVLFSH